jgi:excisionase family DNA binding protein
METTERLLTIQETAQMLRISVPTLHRIVAAGDLPAVRIGGRTFFDRNDIETFIERSKTKPAVREGRKPRSKEDTEAKKDKK